MIKKNTKLFLVMKEEIKKNNGISCEVNKYEEDNEKYTIVYLDFNIIKKLKEANIDNINPKVIIPFSEIHIRDLSGSVFENNKDRFMSDLSYLERLTNSREINLIECELKDIESNKIIKIEDAIIKFDGNVYGVLKKVMENIEEEDKKIRGSIKQLEYNLKFIFAEGTNKFENEKIQKLFEENNYIYDKKFILEFLSFYLLGEENIFNTPELYKQIRKLFKNQESIIPDEEFKIFLKIFNENELEELKKYFCPISKFWNKLQCYLGNSERENYLNILLLEFSPLFQDKVSIKNKAENIIRDCRHFQFATYCDYFVTEDKSLIKKISFLLEMDSSIKMKIIKYDELLNLLKNKKTRA